MSETDAGGTNGQSNANGSNGNGNGQGGASGAPIQARVVGQFIRDLSFEVPSTERVIAGPKDNPNLQLEVNVNAQHLEKNRFESSIEFSANAHDSDGAIYSLEVVYTGIFELGRMPEEALEPFLLINCPSLTFPFLRRLVADLTRESGFPPLLLDPIDFGQLYMQRKGQAAGETQPTN